MKRLLWAIPLALVLWSNGQQARAGWTIHFTINVDKIQEDLKRFTGTKGSYEKFHRGEITLQQLEMEVAGKVAETVGGYLGSEIGGVVPGIKKRSAKLGEMLGEQTARGIAEGVVQAIHNKGTTVTEITHAVDDAARRTYNSIEDAGNRTADSAVRLYNRLFGK